MLLRQVQARPLQGDHLRALRRRGDAPEGAPRADGPHRPGRAGQPHLVLQGRPEPDRLPARHRPARAREGALLRRLDRHRRRQRGAREGPERPRGQGPDRVRADLRRPRRGARRARAAAAAAPRLLRQGQGQGLRRGRRLLGARPRQLGRGAGLPTLEEVRTLGSGIFPELAGTVSTEDPKKLRELVRATATRSDRKLAPREHEQVATAAQQIQEALAAAPRRARPGVRLQEGRSDQAREQGHRRAPHGHRARGRGRRARRRRST